MKVSIISVAATPGRVLGASSVLRSNGLAICLLATLVTGCGTIPSTAIAPKTSQDASTACYMYGRFQESDPSPWYLQNAFGNDMAVVLVLKEMKSGTAYQIRFQESDPVVAIAVRPGEYSVSEIVFARRKRILETRPIASGLIKGEIVIAPGQGCYLGDWLAHASSQSYGAGSTVGGGYVSGNIRHEEQWDLKSIQNNFGQTTKEFMRIYPYLSGLKPFSAMK